MTIAALVVSPSPALVSGPAALTVGAPSAPAPCSVSPFGKLPPCRYTPSYPLRIHCLYSRIRSRGCLSCSFRLYNHFHLVSSQRQRAFHLCLCCGSQCRPRCRPRLCPDGLHCLLFCFGSASAIRLCPDELHRSVHCSDVPPSVLPSAGVISRPAIISCSIQGINRYFTPSSAMTIAVCQASSRLTTPRILAFPLCPPSVIHFRTRLMALYR